LFVVSSPNITEGVFSVISSAKSNPKFSFNAVVVLEEAAGANAAPEVSADTRRRDLRGAMVTRGCW